MSEKKLFSGQLRVAIKADSQAQAEYLFDWYLKTYGTDDAPSLWDLLTVVEQDVVEV